MNPHKNIRRNMLSILDMIESDEPQEPIDIQFATEVALHVFTLVGKLKPLIKCDTCYFYEQGICKKASIEPPDRVKPIGCEMWMDTTLDPWDKEMWDMNR